MKALNGHYIVLGMGVTGIAVTRYLLKHGHKVTMADSADCPSKLLAFSAEFPQVDLRLGAFHEASFSDADTLICSPGIAISTPEIAAFAQSGKPVIGDIELFAQRVPRHLANKNKIIAITGSNGKTTVTSLTGHLCASSGLTTIVAGNIGMPVLEILSECEDQDSYPDVWVLELSSFQLETTYSLNADVATCLNISEDHLDRYTDLLDYAHSKTRVFQGTGIQVLNQDDVFCCAMSRAGREKRMFSLKALPLVDYQLNEMQTQLLHQGQMFYAVADIPLQGLHNAANVLAAVALCEAIGLQKIIVLNGIASFVALRHRVELVKQVGRITFIDDSKGTNVGATVAALNGMTQPLILIAGGLGKGQDFRPLFAATARICRAVVLIGRDAALIEDALKGNGVPIVHADQLTLATELAAKLAVETESEVVLLSPACASFDQFKGYAHRAQVFIDTVNSDALSLWTQ
ncbi:MAG: UDP-N-acetylmuramoyl-L-alanine--D-glutamate ligase [Neisseriaceae bacterium]|nr:UDP-N-acetylmuramoyl-L-alanine--D-glutamate ligase [Neisseriaceae bacterium]